MINGKRNKISQKTCSGKTCAGWLNVKFGVKAAFILTIAVIVSLVILAAGRWVNTKAVIPAGENTGPSFSVQTMTVKNQLGQYSNTLNPVIPIDPDKEPNPVVPVFPDDSDFVPKNNTPTSTVCCSGHMSGAFHI